MNIMSMDLACLERLPRVPFYQAAQLDPGITQDALTRSVLHLQPQYLVLDGRVKPSHPVQNIMTVAAKQRTPEHFIVEP